VTRPRVSAAPRTRLARRTARRPEGSRGKRIALVTGAARGIGAATVQRLVLDGWHVVAVDRAEDDPRLPYALGSAEQLAGLASERVQPVAADVTDAEAMQAAVDMALKRWGGLDAVVAAAGVIAGGVPAWELDAEQERAVLEVDLGGVITAARAGIPAMLRRPEPRDGRFIAVASAAASKGLPMLAAYCAAKAGVTGFTRALAVELRGSGITANAVSPGSTRTDMLVESARLYGVSTDDFAAQPPLDRLLEPDEVAALIAWLVSPQARGATGGDYPLDGGMAAL
jgi:SDR family mycofactocin-dependent oxidoreductase